MSNFRLNLPIDIPWTLVNCSEDMMDKTFCDKLMPSPFRSSIALYTYDPKEEDIPEEYSKCGKQITYLKISCSITGYQPGSNAQTDIVDLLANVDGIDYRQIEEIKSEYFGCYGVLLNVSVHPIERHKDDLTKYPHIIDFEPKIRDFYQAATETGEVLTASVNKVATNKSYGTTDSTQSSWSGGATIRVPEQSANIGVPGVGEVGASKGSPGEVRGDTGQMRTETDQQNWGITTDASRERRENQSTSTQLSQMYNLLTGLHAGTNRASFIMLPRPHILQPTDERTFAHGLRVIEGMQDFFLVVLRDKTQPLMNVDIFLQTGHFPENLDPVDNAPPSIERSFSVKVDNTAGMKDGIKFFVFDFREPEEISDTVSNINPYLNEGFTIDTSKEIIVEKLAGDTDLFPRVYSADNLPPRLIRDKSYISGENLIVEYTIKGDSVHKSETTRIHRKYSATVSKRVDSIIPANPNQLLITQRKLCTQITYGECISAKDVTKVLDGLPPVLVDDLPVLDYDIDPGVRPVGPPGLEYLEDFIWGEHTIDLSKAYKIPDHNKIGNKNSSQNRSDFGFKKGVIGLIHNAMVSSLNTQDQNEIGPVKYTQTKHFQKRLLQVLPKEILDAPIEQLAFVNPAIKGKMKKDMCLKDLLKSNELELSKKFGIIKNEIIDFKNSDRVL